MTDSISRGELCEATDLAELTEFFREAWSEDPNASNAETIQWRYRHGNANRSFRGTHLVWRDGESGGKIAAHMGILPVRLSQGDGAFPPLDAAWLLDWLVLKTFRGARVGTFLMKEALSRHPLSLAIGLTRDSELIFRRARWFDLGLVKSFGRVEDGGAFLRARWPAAGKIPGAGPLAKLVFAHRNLGKTRADDLEIQISDHYPDDAFLLLQDAKFMRIRRDERFLSARYGSPPWMTKHIMAREGGRLRAWSAWSVKTRQDGLRVGMLLELLAASPREEEIVLRRGIGAMQDEGAGILIVQQRNVLREELMRKYGFLPRAGLRFMGYWRDGADAAPLELKDPDRWIIQAGDSDLDR